jgi:hypothetical protein
LLRKKKYFFGKAFFLKERFIEVRGMFDDEEGKGFYYRRL